MKKLLIILLLSSCSSVKIQNVEIRQKTNITPKEKVIYISSFAAGFIFVDHFYNNRK
jgi:hypothetical protein